MLFHGRGADERDLFPLLDHLDPARRLLGVTRAARSTCRPAAPTGTRFTRSAPGPGTFTETFALASSWLDAVAADRASPGAHRIGGFSQGAVMTYALGLGEGRPRPAGLITLSGFIPTAPRFELDLTSPSPAWSSVTARSTRLSPWSGAGRACGDFGEAGADVGSPSAPRWRARSTRAFSRAAGLARRHARCSRREARHRAPDAGHGRRASAPRRMRERWPAARGRRHVEPVRRVARSRRSRRDSPSSRSPRCATA